MITRYHYHIVRPITALTWCDHGEFLWRLDSSGRLSSFACGKTGFQECQVACAANLESLQFSIGGRVGAKTSEGRLLVGRLGACLEEVSLPVPVQHVSLDQDGQQFCALAVDKSQIWCGYLQSRRAHWLLEGDYADMAPVWSAQADQGPRLAVFEKRRVLVYRNGKNIPECWASLKSKPQAASWAPCSPLLAIGLQDGGVALMDGVYGRVIYTAPGGQPIRWLFWEPSGRRLLAGSSSETWLLSLTGKEAEVSVEKQRKTSYVARCGAYRPRSALFAAGCKLGRVIVSRPASDVEPRVIHCGDKSIEALAWSPNGKRLAFVDETGKISVIRVRR